MGDLEHLLGDLRATCIKRGVDGIAALARMFRVFDKDGNNIIDLEEFTRGLRRYNLTLSDEEVNCLFAHFDKDSNGFIDYDEFLEKIRPSMPQTRIDLIREVFTKLDVTGDGRVTVEDMTCAYNEDREGAEGRSFELFLNDIRMGAGSNVVEFEDFVRYYSSVSASIDLDEYFEQMIRQAWKM